MNWYFPYLFYKKKNKINVPKSPLRKNIRPHDRIGLSLMITYISIHTENCRSLRKTNCLSHFTELSLEVFAQVINPCTAPLIQCRYVNITREKKQIDPDPGTLSNGKLRLTHLYYFETLRTKVNSRLAQISSSFYSIIESNIST